MQRVRMIRSFKRFIQNHDRDATSGLLSGGLFNVTASELCGIVVIIKKIYISRAHVDIKLYICAVTSPLFCILCAAVVYVIYDSVGVVLGLLITI